MVRLVLHFGCIILVSMVAFPLSNCVTERDRRPASSYAVEGCYNEFQSTFHRHMQGSNSNVRCQEICRNMGYILAGTKGQTCRCSNIFPAGKKVGDDKCSLRCRSWSPCHQLQSCCGGPEAYTVSVVGNIDVPKQILRRLSRSLRTKREYRNYIKSVALPKSRIVSWLMAPNAKEWSVCDKNEYLTGLWRNDPSQPLDRISLIEKADCITAPSYLYPSSNSEDCYEHNWWLSFDKQGWSTCNKGYFLQGLYRNGGSGLYLIEYAKCCRPKKNVLQWGHCYEEDVSLSFDKKGWGKCNAGYYMVGLYRSSCNHLYCLERFKCCQMGPSWIKNVRYSIKMRDVDGQFKECSMDPLDRSHNTKSYKCEKISNKNNILELKALSFKIEDKTELNVAQPKPIPGFRPVTCSSSPFTYTCAKDLWVAIATSTSFTIGSGFNMGVSIGASVETSASFFGSGVKVAFQTEVSMSSSFNTERSTSMTKTTTDKTQVSIVVPKNTQMRINMLRATEDLEYKWKAFFTLVGKYSMKWNNEFSITDDVTTVLAGDKGQLYAFGRWTYPGTDTITVIITDQYGKVVRSTSHKVSQKTGP